MWQVWLRLRLRLLDSLRRLRIVHTGISGLYGHARHKLALGAPVEARRAAVVKGPSLRCCDTTLHEGVSTDPLWVDCLIAVQRRLLDMIGKLREHRRVSLLLMRQMQVRKLWEILSQMAVLILGTVAFSNCI